MFKKEILGELKTTYDNINKISGEVINIKIAIHNLEKLGFNVDEFYKKLDDLGIELKKLRDYNDDFTKKVA